MANTDNAFSFRFVRSAYGDTSPPVAKHLVSEDVSYGDPVAMGATNGELVIVGTGGEILGFAIEDAEEDDYLHYAIARVGDVWKAQADFNVDADDIGQRVGIAGTASGELEVDDNSTGALIIEGLADEPDNEWGSHAVLNLRVAVPQTEDV